MSDTTSIDDLPTDPSTGSQNNIVIQKTEMNSGMGMGMGGGMVGGMSGGMGMNNQIQNQAPVYSPNIGGMGGGMGQPQQQPQQMMMAQQNQNPGIMNEFISGLQRASGSGMTSLSSRDIPMNTMNMMGDQQIKPNYIPQPQQNEQSNNYIEEHEADIANEVKYATSVSNNDKMENIYRLIQVPLLVGIMYFAFQLPITRKYILKYLPSVFNADGNYNISGLVFMSALFAVGYFGLIKMIESVEAV
jgi:hypothetical protein